MDNSIEISGLLVQDSSGKPGPLGKESALLPHVDDIRKYIITRLLGGEQLYSADIEHRLRIVIGGLIIDDRGLGELDDFRNRRHIGKTDIGKTDKGAESPDVAKEFGAFLDGMKDGLSGKTDELVNLTKQQDEKPLFEQMMFGRGMVYGLVARGCTEKDMYKFPLELIGNATGKVVEATSVVDPETKLEFWESMMKDYTNIYGFGLFVEMKNYNGKWGISEEERIPFEAIYAGENAAHELVFGRDLLIPENKYARRLVRDIDRKDFARRVENEPLRRYFRDNLPSEVLVRSNVWPDDIKNVPSADYLIRLFHNEEGQWANAGDKELFDEIATQLIVRNIKKSQALEGNDPEKIGGDLRRIVRLVGYGLRKASLAVPLIQDIESFSGDDRGRIIEAFGVGKIATGNVGQGIAILRSLGTDDLSEADVFSGLRPVLETIRKSMQTEGTKLQKMVRVLGTEKQFGALFTTS